MNARFALVTLSLAMLGGCGDDPSAEAEGNLTQAGRKLIGAYMDQGGGPFRALVLTSETVTSNANSFFADIVTDAPCVANPCELVERVEGTFTAGTKTLTLKSKTASKFATPFLGKYNYQVIGEKFSLSRNGFQESLEHVVSYCGAVPEADCDRQDVIHPMCAGGGWTCSATSTCGWSCDDIGTPELCYNGSPVNGPDSFLPSADGKECKLPDVHCVTDDSNACPQWSPPSPDYCADGTRVSGPLSFMESSDGKECTMYSLHCVTNDGGACPQWSAPSPDYCAGGTVVHGPDSFIESDDGMECLMPSVHCVTNDLDACPQF